MKAKVVVLSSGVLAALLLLLRYFALSRAGIHLGWMLYLGLPITAAGVLFALRLINLGAGWSTKAGDIKPSGPSLSERLEALEALHARGGISDADYSAERLHIISNL